MFQSNGNHYCLALCSEYQDHGNVVTLCLVPTMMNWGRGIMLRLNPHESKYAATMGHFFNDPCVLQSMPLLLAILFNLNLRAISLDSPCPCLSQFG